MRPVKGFHFFKYFIFRSACKLDSALLKGSLSQNDYFDDLAIFGRADLHGWLDEMERKKDRFESSSFQTQISENINLSWRRTLIAISGWRYKFEDFFIKFESLFNRLETDEVEITQVTNPYT